MRRSLLFTAVICLVLTGETLRGSSGPVTASSLSRSQTGRAPLQAGLDRQLLQPRFRHAQWGVRVVDLRTGRILCQHGADQLFTPASLTKLFTAALALHQLGPEHRLQTTLYAERAPRPDGVLEGPLILTGQGDPGFRWDADAPEPLRSFDPLVQVVQKAGIRVIEGGLIAEETFLGGFKYGPGWSWEDLRHPYGAPLSDLNANENRVRLEVAPADEIGQPCRMRLIPPTDGLWLTNLTTTVAPGQNGRIQWTRPPGRPDLRITGSLPHGATTWTAEVAVEDPATLFLELFRRALEHQGIQVRGPYHVRVVGPGPIADRPSARAIPLGTVASAPVRELVRITLKQSHNLTASVLWAAALRPNPTAPTQSGSTPDTVLNRFFQSMGIATTEIYLEEGSGLSRNNLVTPGAVVRLLQSMHQHREFQVFQAALPVAGVDGTLAHRMRGTAAEGIVRAKTGTLRWAHGLAGYIFPEQGRPLAFCLILNRYRPNPADPSPQAELDRLAAWLADEAGRMSTP
jgi:D-alanyl-D-alanine carboxypeptidase/D-alanyl-D-alanine-endopeptidase (penicillin-binding protein 4)